jgi:hypothetical protein
MAISDEEIIEWIGRIKNKCLITGKILDIKPKLLNDCETILDVIVKWKDGYYTIKMVKTTKGIWEGCPIVSQYKSNNYKADIWKEKSFLVNKDWLDIVDMKKLPWVDLTKIPPPLMKIDWLGLITTWEYWIKQFPNIETCQSNLTTKDYYLNYVLPNYKNEILNSNHTVYYIWVFILLVILLSVLIYKKIKKQKK